jgi:hypothetical protein
MVHIVSIESWGEQIVADLASCLKVIANEGVMILLRLLFLMFDGELVETVSHHLHLHL